MRFFAALVCLVLFTSAAWAEKRLALVIGNNAYSNVAPLEKAGPDANAVSQALADQGFDVLTVLDATRREMNRRIAEFTGMLDPGDTAFVFYAGHGVEIDGENYLLPSDIIAPASGDRDFIKSESIALSNLLDRVRATGARTTIAIIDACRNNPFQTTTGRSIGATRGLGRITAPEGTFVIFSAGAGQLALDKLDQDDANPNSVFTRMLLPHLSRPGLELRAMMADLRVEVRNLARTVNHEQFPAYYDELLGDFYFASTEVAPTPRTASQQPAPATNTPTRKIDPMREDFELARGIGTPGALQAFLDAYKTRNSEFTYRMAQQLLQQATPDAPAIDPEAAPQVAALPAPAPPDPNANRRDLIRQTQSALNIAGCSAGGADGVIGPRTRRAFARFIRDNGTALNPADLGSARALRAVVAAGRGGCKAIVAAPAATSTTTDGFNLTGTWRYKATCALLLKYTGTVIYTKTGPNTFKGQLSDSLGQHATSRITLNGRAMKGRIFFPNLSVTIRGRLSADGNTYSEDRKSVV